MKTIVTLLSICLILLFATPTTAQTPSQFEWFLQTEGDGTALASSFISTGKTEIALTTTISAEWSCRVSELVTSKDAVQRTLICYHKDPQGYITGALASKVACRTDGTKNVASTFLMVATFQQKQDGTPEAHRMEFSLTCSKRQ